MVGPLASTVQRVGLAALTCAYRSAQQCRTDAEALTAFIDTCVEHIYRNAEKAGSGMKKTLCNGELHGRVTYTTTLAGINDGYSTTYGTASIHWRSLAREERRTQELMHLVIVWIRMKEEQVVNQKNIQYDVPTSIVDKFCS